MKNLKPFHQGYLPKQDGHKVFFIQYGNPKGSPIVSLHGGPGAKSKPKHVKGLDLEKYHVVAFDQRGCGKSQPAGEIANNNLEKLISDAQRLRKHLKIKKWFVMGGSWGSTLALAYAQKHPERVRGMLLRSMFLARSRDVDWSCTSEGGISRIFPDLWENNLTFLSNHKATPTNYAKVLLNTIQNGSDKQVRQVVAGVSNWEDNLMNSQADISITDPEDVDEDGIAYAKIFLHYEANNFFLKENQLIEGIKKIESIPTVIVHGRYDLLCPIEQMWELKKALKNVQVVILPSSNHRLTADGEIAKNLAFNLFLEKNLKHN
jgi:proline iminopeptidase